MRGLERSLLLARIDDAWKKHLLTMDHLRSGIGLVGYAQVDPKTEYKREGMKAFDEMWDGVQDKITEAVFRMEEEEGFQEVVGFARHEEAPRFVANGDGDERHDDERRPEREEAGADPQRDRPRGPQRPVPLRQRQEVQELPHAAAGDAGGEAVTDEDVLWPDPEVLRRAGRGSSSGCDGQMAPGGRSRKMFLDIDDLAEQSWIPLGSH